MNIEPIQTEEEYQVALRELESLMNAEYGTAEGNRLDVLAALIEIYEANQGS